MLGNGSYRVDEAARFTFAPQSTGSVDGFPAYVAGENFIVITSDRRPLFTPVTQQQLLEVRIAERRASLRDMQAALAGVADSPAKAASLDAERKRLTALESELSALTDVERAQPALDPDGTPTRRASGLAETGAVRTRAIVTVNPALFDRQKPRTSVQLVVIGTIRYEPELFRALQQQIDKAALLRLLD